MNTTYKLSKKLQANLREMSREELVSFAAKLGNCNYMVQNPTPYQMRVQISYRWAEEILKAIKSV